MSEVTLTYTPSEQGWTSTWSYIPDWMTGMNNNFYSWKNGSLYKHHSTNVARNNFYGVQYSSSITTIFNQEAIEDKMFKTISLLGNDKWDATITTNLSTGYIDKTYFANKEGVEYAYIRRVDNTIDTKAISTQGIGTLLSLSTLTLNFAFNITDSHVSVGDKIYKVLNGSLVLLGTVQTHNTTSITLASIATTVAQGDMIVYVKNSVAESYGARGYYMQVKLDNSSTTDVELFSVGTTLFKSNY